MLKKYGAFCILGGLHRMKKSIFRKGASALLAFVMCLSTFMGIGSTTAFAAGEEVEAFLVSFPRDGDSNSWGHDSLT